MWGDCPKADIMDAWREGLRGIDPDAIALALSTVHVSYQQWPPTLGEFVALCKPVVPAAHRLLLPAPPREPGKMDPRIKAEIDKLLDPKRKRDPKDWARGILRDHEAGTYTLICGVEMARRALA